MNKQIQSRNDFPTLLNEMGLTSYAVEVGTHEGTFAETILSTWDGQQLTCVDPWIYQSDVVQDASNISDTEHQICYEKCIYNLKSYLKSKKARILRDFSVNAVETFEDESLDFVYLDARHDYKSVFSDISLWYPKVKKSGILAGHDYFYRNSRRNLVEVSRAVKDFFYNKHDIYTTEDNLPSWYIFK